MQKNLTSDREHFVHAFYYARERTRKVKGRSRAAITYPCLIAEAVALVRSCDGWITFSLTCPRT